MPTKRRVIPDNAPFSEKETEWLDQFFQKISQEQAIWLSGFVSGFQAKEMSGNVCSDGQKPHENPSQGTIPQKPKLLVLFGSESGNAESLAAEAKKRAGKLGIKARLVDMADTNPSDLAKESNVLVFVSTWGEGDPPERAATFYKELMSNKAARLEGVRFGVLGLGDTAYEKFCQMGKDIDRRLEALGGTRIVDRIDCDIDYEDAADKWLSSAFDALLKSSNHDASGVPPVEVLSYVGNAPKPTLAKVEYGKKHPFPAELTERVVLNGTGSQKETLHLELSLEGSGMTYEPGDALAVIPVNCDEVVTDIVRAANLKDEQTVTNKGGESIDLHSYIMKECDATILSKVFLQKYNKLKPHDEISRLLLPDNKSELQQFMWGREIVDILLDYPIEHLSANNLTDLLRRLPPRLYSIASSMKEVSDEVHLTVAAVRYHSHRRSRKGVCSTFLADRVDVGGTIPVYVQPNKHFKLPEDGNAPMIMVGPGTGVAPFRAFLQERQAVGASGKNWLLYGDQHFTYDFLYQLEWQDYAKDGVLTRMDTAFSRDTPDKVYVQHRMLQNSREIYKWLEEGAYFYVCGDASRMAHDVHNALKSILIKEGAHTEESADEYLNKLKKSKRYQRDVY